MIVLVFGLLIFLGVHSIRIFADGWRSKQISRLGAGTWKATYSVISLLGFGLIIWGFGMARADTMILWSPPIWAKHAAALLMLLAFILLVAAYIPGNHIKSKIGHPMLAGTKTWAFAHLLANGSLADVVLFGSFIIWSMMAFATLRRRDRAAGVSYPVLGIGRSVLTVFVGVVAWALFGRYLHVWLIGVNPLT
jgi:uncharacterized membrane protein